jgi:hypothetical protein
MKPSTLAFITCLFVVILVVSCGPKAEPDDVVGFGCDLGSRGDVQYTPYMCAQATEKAKCESHSFDMQPEGTPEDPDAGVIRHCCNYEHCVVQPALPIPAYADDGGASD